LLALGLDLTSFMLYSFPFASNIYR
jgi:hypothetical protein